MLTPEERATIKAFMGEAENIDEYKRALAVLQLDDGIPLDMIGLSVKHVQRMRRKFRSISVLAFDGALRNSLGLLNEIPYLAVLD